MNYATPVHLAPRSDATGSVKGSVPIKVVLAVDHTAARRSLRRLLDGCDDVEVVADAAGLSAATRWVRTSAAAVLVLDLRLTRETTGEEIRRLRAQIPTTEIVVLTMDESAAVSAACDRRGAVGFVLKDRADSELMPRLPALRAEKSS